MWRGFSRFGMMAVVGFFLLATVWIELPTYAQAQSISQMCGSDKILFAGGTEENFQVYVFDVTRGTQQRLSDPKVSSRDPVWSPDGRQVAFFTEENSSYTIVIGNIEKLPNERVTIPLQYPIWGISWSPDGKPLVFAEQPLGQRQVPPINRVLVILDLEARTRNLLTITQGPISNPQWSPLGTEILFERSVGGGTVHIYLVSSDGLTMRRIVSKYGGYYPVWYPDGQTITYQLPGRGLLLTNRDGSNKHPISHPTNISGRYPTWSPNGKCLAFAEGNITLTDAEGIPIKTLDVAQERIGPFDLRWQPNVQAKHQFILPTPTAIPTFPNPRLSQLMGKLIYASKRNAREDIYVMDANGTNEHRLTNAGSKNTTPKLSPDGKLIAFVSDRDGRDHIYVMNVDGSGSKRLTRGDDWESDPIWSVDGRQLILTAQSNLDRRESRYTVRVNLDSLVQEKLPFWGYSTWSRRGDSYVESLGEYIYLCPVDENIGLTQIAFE